MTFTVTYRGADGTLREEAVKATDRAECFAQCKARGIAPVSVKEGASLGERASRPFRSRDKGGLRNAQDARCPSAGGKPRSPILNLKSSIFLAAALAVAGGVWWWLAAREDARPPEAIGPAAPAAPQKPAPPATGRQAAKGGEAPAKAVRRAFPPPARPKVPEAGGTDGGETGSRPEEGLQEAVPPTATRIARTGAEELLMLVTPSTPGGRVPPLPDLRGIPVEEDMREALGRAVVAEKGDDEPRLERKLLLAQQKEEFGELSREGWSFAGYLQALREKNNTDADYLRDAHKMLDALYRDETVSDEEYKDCRDKVNKTLLERGLPEIE